MAQSEQSIWQAVDYGRRLYADRVLLGICRNMIERTLNEMASGHRTKKGVAERLDNLRK